LYLGELTNDGSQNLYLGELTTEDPRGWDISKKREHKVEHRHTCEEGD
jgi:hypothetical protein